MLEFRFYGIEVDPKYLLSEFIMDRLKHLPGFVGIHPGEVSVTIIFEDHIYAEDLLNWKRFAHVPIIRRGLVHVPVKDIPKSRRRKYKRYITVM